MNARTAFSLLFPPILDEFGWDRGMTAGAFSFGFVASMLFTPVLGRLMDRWGPRRVIPAGVAMVCLGLALGTQVRHPWHLYLTLGLLVAGGTVTVGYTGHALFLTGGGVLALPAAGGVLRYLEERKIGFDWGNPGLRIPIVVSAVIDEAVTSGARVVFLEVRAGNVVARRLYRQLGFRDLGVRRGYYGPGQDAIVMELPLDGR